MSENIEFEVGHKYENMKGVYEVISINGDSMIIRWKNGEQISTSTDLQSRIIQRMQREKQERDNERMQNQPKEPKRKNRKSTSKYRTQFKGFEESDFKKNVTETNWRSRSCLGGAVTERLSSDKFNLNSWAVYRMPAIHWADVKHRGRDDISLQAKFFAQVDENYLYYGFYIERSDNPTHVKNDWNTFISWLQDAKNEYWLNEIVSEHNLGIYDLEEKSFSGIIKSSNEKWEIHNDEMHNEEILSLSNLLDELPKKRWVDLHIAKKVNKDEVLTKGETIADDISALFEILMPLYEASTAHAT